MVDHNFVLVVQSSDHILCLLILLFYCFTEIAVLALCYTMVEGSPFPGNQLLFNLCNGSAPTTMSTKFNTPKPIFIEKIPVAGTPPRNGFGPTSVVCVAMMEKSVWTFGNVHACMPLHSHTYSLL